MDDVLGYRDQTVVVTGAASGMGAATVEVLAELGARVVGIDVRPVEGPVDVDLQVDLREKAAIDAAVARIEGPVHAVFSVAGLPGPPFPDMDVVLVNFIGARHLIESLVPKMPAGSAIACVASNAGMNWPDHLDVLLECAQTDGFDAAVAWCEDHPEKVAENYGFTKEVLNVWVRWRAASLIDQGIRLNCTNPGPTETAMMPAFEGLAGAALIDAFLGPIGRRSRADEQAWPLVMLNSPRMEHVTGESLAVDGGFVGAHATGCIDLDQRMAQAFGG